MVQVIKSDSKEQVCGDYRVTVNKFCKLDGSPVPKPDDPQSKLAGGRTSLNLNFVRLMSRCLYVKIRGRLDNQYTKTLTAFRAFRMGSLQYLASSRKRWKFCCRSDNL